MAYTDEELKAAVQRLTDPERFGEAERMVATVAPDLQKVLIAALGEGGWFGEAHRSEALKAATDPDEQRRIDSIQTLLNEETHMGMMVGVAVGWALCKELEEGTNEPEGEN